MSWREKDSREKRVKKGDTGEWFSAMLNESKSCHEVRIFVLESLQITQYQLKIQINCLIY